MTTQLYGLLLMRFAARPTRVHGGVLADLVDGMRYLRSRPALRTLVLLALLPVVFGTPYMTMLTVFAKDVLDVGGGGLGLLTACSGAGGGTLRPRGARSAVTVCPPLLTMHPCVARLT